MCGIDRAQPRHESRACFSRNSAVRAIIAGNVNSCFARANSPIIDQMKPYSKYFEKIRVRPRPGGGAEVARADLPVGRLQARPGTHRAPVGRMKEGEYFRFCFDHVREYNKGYNYFSGLAGHRDRPLPEGSDDRPPADLDDGRQWRSTRSFARCRAEALRPRRLLQPHARPVRPVRRPRRTRARPRERKAKPLEAKALETLGLDTKATGSDIKSRYKELVKRHHPDANGGDRGSEDRFRDVLQAYRVLKQAGLC